MSKVLGIDQDNRKVKLQEFLAPNSESKEINMSTVKCHPSGFLDWLAFFLNHTGNLRLN